jgi:riboflavin biosynthesis pyrimidine reductase
MIGGVRLIFPTDRSGEIDLDALYGVPRPAPSARPWLGLSMITSLDGSTAVGGLSGGLGNDGDRAVFRALRRAADVVLVGARTVVTERYRTPSKRGQRIGVVTASGRVDPGTDLFSSGSGFLVMPEDGAEGPPGVAVVRAGLGAVDLAAALAQLDEVAPGVQLVQAEGGPRLNAALLEAGCVDELDLTIAPVIAGGTGSRVIAGASEALRPYELVHVLVDGDGYLFTRWVQRDRAC